MKKFKFTLQTVHNVREMRQEKEELVLSAAADRSRQSRRPNREIEQCGLKRSKFTRAGLNRASR